MSQPYIGLGNDGEGGNYLSPWYTRGYTAHLGANGVQDYSPLIYAPPNDPTLSGFPLDQAMTVVQGRYFDADRDPLGGYLTFWPSSGFTITDTDSVSMQDNCTFYIPQRLLGTETWPSVDSGVSPWAFSMEGSGKIFIYEGLLVARLYSTDNPNVVTDNLQPLTYHVIEHFLGGRQYDILVPTSDTPVQLTDCIIPMSVQPASNFSAMVPLGSAVDDFELQALAITGPIIPPLPVQQINADSTDYVIANITAALPNGTPVDPTEDTISFAFMTTGMDPGVSDWIPATWVAGGPPYTAQLLVGPDGIILGKGTYRIYAQLIDVPQTIVQLIGLLYIS